MTKEQVYGLVACGGQSTRMGSDKSLLDYHGMPQQFHLYKILTELCGRVFISCNQQQADSIPEVYSIIPDAGKYAGIGPMASLLSAFDAYPGQSFLVVGCDYPMINSNELAGFLRGINDRDAPASFFNAAAGVYEPLLAYYPASAAPTLQRMFLQKNYSLRHYLQTQAALQHCPADDRSIISADTPQQSAKILQLINQQQP